MIKRLKNIRGFTATELLVVTTIMSLIPTTSYIGAKNKALQVQCGSQLRQIGMAINMFEMSQGTYPDAKFYPEDPLNDKKSIVVLLKPHGMSKKIFVCPGAPLELQKKGLTYLWNDALSGKSSSQIKNPSTTWMMVDITAAYDGVSSHMGGYNILYADGHVEWSSRAPSLIPEK